MSKEKVKGYINSFIVGGMFGAVAFLMFTAFLMMGISVIFSITFMVYGMALLSGLLAMVGVQQKLTQIGGMGAMMPMGGLSGGMAEYIVVLRNQGMPTKAVVKESLVAPLKIFGACFGMACLMAIISKFGDIHIVIPADPMKAIGFAPLVTGFQPIGIVNAFLISGIFCFVGQIFFVNTNLGFVKIFMGCVSLGAIMAATGVMSYLTNFGSAGMILSVTDAGEGAFLGFYGLIVQGKLFGIIRYTSLVLAILITGVVCGLLAPKDANEKFS